MESMILISVVFALAVIMSMVGRGGGNFYVPVIIATGASMHEAATTAQLILVVTAVAALIVYQQHQTIDWKLAAVIDIPTDIMAFFGGYYAHLFSGALLKLVFAVLLVIASALMLYPMKQKTASEKHGLGYWRRRYAGAEYIVNLWIALPITAVTGLAAGMVGVSGGSFKIPLMVLACGVPMRVAIGTSSAMVAATALMGFIGHSIRGEFNPSLALSLAFAAVAGGLLGAKFSIKTKPERLKLIFGFTTLAAAFFMAFSAYSSS